MSKVKIEAILKEAFKPTYLNVVDDSAKHAGHAGARGDLQATERGAGCHEGLEGLLRR